MTDRLKLMVSDTKNTFAQGERANGPAELALSVRGSGHEF